MIRAAVTRATRLLVIALVAVVATGLVAKMIFGWAAAAIAVVAILYAAVVRPLRKRARTKR